MDIGLSGRLRRWSGRTGSLAVGHPVHVGDRRTQRSPRPGGPPIEQLADDLRRLLWRHDEFTGSSGTATQTKLLRALEAAISARAMQAARALGVPHPDLPAFEVDTEQLRRLLHALSGGGLVLPPEAGLLAPDRRP
jgi:hypothetical protein